MADMTPTTAFAHAPASAAKTTLRGAVDTLMTAIDTFKTTADTGTTQVWTAAVSGTPTGGTYTLTFTGSSKIAAQTLTLDYNASAATLQTAIRALTGSGFSQATVSASGSGANLTHTITLKGMREDVQLSRSIAGLTGGVPALALTETTPYAAIPLVSTQSITMVKQALVDWCELFASELRR
jgi:hypothetical protein